MVKRTLPAITLTFLTIMAVGLLFLPIPYVILMPGETTNLLQKELRVTGEKPYAGKGTLSMVSVSATTPSFYVNGSAIIWALLDQRVAAVPKTLVYAPGQDDKAVRSEELADMKNSQVGARYAAGQILRFTPAQIEKLSFTLKDKYTGGPSGGLAFGLAILAKLGDTDFIRNRTIVATGTLDSAGNVGPIGGIDLKLYTAEHAGAKIFLAPERNCVDIHHRPRGMKIYAVATLQEAYSVLSGSSAHLRNCT
jgi:PDZ domain-containing protein